MSKESAESSPRLHRFTLNMTPRGVEGRDTVSEYLGCRDDTEAVNRGMAFAAQIIKIIEEGGVITDKDGMPVRIIIT